MRYEVLVAIADTPDNRTIEEGDPVELIGRYGIVQARVEIRIHPDGLLQDIMLHLRIARDAAGWQLEGVETLRRFERGIVQTPVLELRRLR
ncbi:hypothetical protein J5226_19940 [Lysobacter sp. K5869]|uniref:hypothetical protein n=1 Tax=Lysobacter sp. K5869 TaxID=2820808 RepID=UPI001C06467C|nr:hypothetical protein [Lysobacter sp. K5869]QWP75856.1 hypothetical protein J5226_19940 [Lysobacter sp. K5869]